MSGYFKDLINQSLERTRESTLSILGLGDSGLRAHLAKQMSNLRWTPSVGQPEGAVKL